RAFHVTGVQTCALPIYFERATVQAGDTEIGVVTQTGALSQAQFALESSRDVLQEYNDYFATPYPLPKLDNVASPGRSQFFSAMELGRAACKGSRLGWAA